MTQIRFALAPGQNHFFFELAEALCSELTGIGVAADVAEDLSAEGSGAVDVLLPPHEFFVLRGADRPSPGRLRRTIFISAEQPETIHFRQNLALAPQAGAVFDINARAVAAYRRRGVPASHLQLGYTPAWDHFGDAGQRPLDVLFLGAFTDRRAQILAAHAERLAALRSRIVFSDNSRPNTPGSPGFLAGEEKWSALRGARVLLNVHQGAEPYFEWHRVLQAIHCGAAVVTESSSDHSPLRAGEHIEVAAPDDLADAVARLAGDERLRSARARAAYDLVREELPLRLAAESLAAEAERVAAGTAPRAGLRGRAAARLAAARVRIAEHRRPPPVGAPACPRPGRLSWERLDGGELLVTEAGAHLLPGAVARLQEGLARGTGAFAFGLVVVDGTGVGNPLAWEAGRPLLPPVLVRAGMAGRAEEALRADDTPGLAALESLGSGVNTQAFVAARA